MDPSTTSSTPESLTVEVFRAGEYGPKGVYTNDDLDAMAADYNPTAHEAPVTLDHQQEGPAHGWVRSLTRMGDRLVATIDRISPTLGGLLRTHGYRKRSVELYRQHASTGRPYLKAVSFLGAAVPEVKGLADPVFSETVSFDEAADRPSAKELLIRRGAWRPDWEQLGLTTVFAALASRSELDTLVEVLASAAPPVSFGRLATDGVALQFRETTVPGASAESTERHRRALAILHADPSLTYRDALLRAAT
jgi:hypothetical protein